MAQPRRRRPFLERAGNVIAKLCSFEDVTGNEHPALTDADCGGV